MTKSGAPSAPFNLNANPTKESINHLKCYWGKGIHLICHRCPPNHVILKVNPKGMVNIPNPTSSHHMDVFFNLCLDSILCPP